MPSPLAPFAHCNQDAAQAAYARAADAADEAPVAFKSFTTAIAGKPDLSVEEWRKFGKLRNDMIVTGAHARRALVNLMMCEAAHSMPPRPHLEPPQTKGKPPIIPSKK